MGAGISGGSLSGIGLLWPLREWICSLSGDAESYIKT